MTPDSGEEGEAADTPGARVPHGVQVNLGSDPESPSDPLWGFTESEK